MKTPEFIWLDGKLVKSGRAQIHLLSHGLHYGSGVFEGIRAYETPRGTAIFRLREHVVRLFRSAAALGITISYTEEQMENAMRQVVSRNGFRECYIRPIVFYGEGQMGLLPRGAKIHIAIAAWPWGAYLGEHKALSVCISPYARFHPKSIIPGAKICGLYAISVAATLDAHARGFDECIMLDHEGFVAEGAGENIFIIKNGKLFTSNSASILKGVTRASVIQIADDLKISVAEKKISPRELIAADEAFFTGTAVEIGGIGKVDKKKIGKTGPITQRIREIYLAAVRGKVPKYKKWLTLVD